VGELPTGLRKAMTASYDDIVAKCVPIIPCRFYANAGFLFVHRYSSVSEAFRFSELYF